MNICMSSEKKMSSANKIVISINSELLKFCAQIFPQLKYHKGIKFGRVEFGNMNVDSYGKMDIQLEVVYL